MSSSDPINNCGVATGRPEDYDVTLHVISVFVIWFLAICGCLIPVIGRKVPSLQINERWLSWLMAFGIGVVIATALIHMIPPAIEKLNNPCLDMQDKYEALAMAIVLATILLMMILETELGIFQTQKASTTTSTPLLTSARAHALSSTKEVMSGGAPQVLCVSPSSESEPQSEFHSYGHVQGHHAHDHSHGLGHSHSHGHGHGHGHGLLMLTSSSSSNDAASARNYISTIIFECGVYAHSILIGIDLGVLAGSDFTALFVALSFHQFFEGIAVGNMSTIAFSSWRTVMTSVVLFSLMTPVGILIGIMISSSYSETSPTSLWVQGVLDAVAGGILLYTGVVELLTHHFTMNTQFQAQPTGNRLFSYLCLLLGAFMMALIAKWA